MDSIKRKFRVTIEKVVEVELTPAVFGDMTLEQYLEEWRKGLWPVDDIDEVANHAAKIAATTGGGYTHDGLGLVNDGDYPRPPDVRFNILDEDVETEAVEYA